MDLVLLLLFVVAVFALWCLKNYLRPLDHPQQPPFNWFPFPIIGALGHIFWYDYHNMALELDLDAHKERNSYSWRIVGIKGISISDPESVQWILNDNFKNYVKGDYMITLLKPLLGEGIFAVNGEKWKNQRLHSKSFFRRQEIEEMIPTFIETSQHVIRILQDKALKRDYFDIQDLFYRFTFDSIMRVGFGIDTINSLDHDPTSNILSDSFNYLQAETDHRGDNPLLRYYSFIRFNRTIKLFNDFIYQMISNRKEHILHDTDSSSSNNLLTKFINTIPPNEIALAQTDTYLRDILVNFFLAGRDTTATLLSFPIYLLLLHPRVEQKLFEEITEHFPGDLDPNDTDGFTHSNLDGMKYLSHVLDEVLRLYPPVPSNFKMALEDDILPNGSFVSKGSEVQYNSWTLHRLKRLWGEDAEEFKPERWENEVKNVVGDKSGMHRFQYIPFHAGPRTCLGMVFALIEAKILIVLLLKNFKISLKPGFNMRVKRALTLQMAEGLLVSVSPRSSEQTVL